MRINTNTSSLTVRQNLRSSTGALSTSIERLSTGVRINGAKDDAAGLGVSNRMTSLIRGNSVAYKNAFDGMAMARAAEEGLKDANDSLQRIRELAVQAANETLTVGDKQSIQTEINQRLSGIENTLIKTSYNGISLLSGSKSLGVQVGAGTTDGDSIPMQVPDLNLVTLGMLDYNVSQVGTLPVGPPITSIGYHYPFPGGGDYTLDLINGNGTIFHRPGPGGTWIDEVGVVGESFRSTGYRWANYGVDAIAKKFDLEESDLTFHQVLQPVDVLNADGTILHKAGDPIDKEYVVKARGEYYAVDPGYHRRRTNTNEARFGITLREYQHPVTLTSITVDPDNVIGSLTDPENNALGIKVTNPPTEETSLLRKGLFVREDGSVFFDTYIMINDKPFKLQIANDAEPVELIEYLSPDGKKMIGLPPPYDVASTGIDGTIIRSNLGAIDEAIAKIDTHRSYLGAFQNRMESAMGNLQQSNIDLQSARSRVQDAEYATEVGNMTKNQILQNASQAILAQANQLPAGIGVLLNK